MQCWIVLVRLDILALLLIYRQNSLSPLKMMLAIGFLEIFPQVKQVLPFPSLLRFFFFKSCMDAEFGWTISSAPTDMIIWLFFFSQWDRLTNFQILNLETPLGYVVFFSFYIVRFSLLTADEDFCLCSWRLFFCILCWVWYQ